MDTPSVQPGLAAGQASHNDVFFRRRVEGPQAKPEEASDEGSILGEATGVKEIPEITEVSDIMRTAKAAESTQGAVQLAKPVPVDESVHIHAEEPVETTLQAPPTVPEPMPSIEPPAPVPEEPVAPTTSESTPQPQKSEGFFKRLFGRLGK